jgi:hypothetical protein
MLCYNAKAGAAAGERPKEAQLVRAAQLLLAHGAGAVMDQADAGGSGSGAAVHGRTALLVAAADGRLQLCELLLSVGAAADRQDSEGQSVLDLLFYLKHSHLASHRSASASYSCMDLYALALRRGLAAAGLLTAELRDDCRGCGACRYLLASLPDPNASSESESEPSSSSRRSMSESESETESEREREDASMRSSGSNSDASQTQGRLHLLFRGMRI